MKALLIAEKPDLARAVENAYKQKGFKDTIDFLAFHGHIMELCSPNDYDEKYKSWDLELTPIFPTNFKYKIKDEVTYKKIVNTIKNNKYDYLINCCDPDREGQLIFHSFYEHIQMNIPVKRMWHSDLTVDELIRALNSMEDDLNTPRLVQLTQASKLRAQIDWLIGMNSTRILTKKRGNVLTRSGRVKIPTLEILAQREKEIQNYVSHNSYLPLINFEYNGSCFNAICEDKIFDSENDYKQYLNAITVFQGKCIEYKKSNNVFKRPQFLSTADVQVQANKQFGFTLAKTLEVLQSLYEKGITSYPRVECNYITENVAKKLPDGLSALKDMNIINDEQVTRINPTRLKEIQTDKAYVDEKKVTSHYAIVLTGKVDNTLNEDERKILVVIAKNLLAALDKECKSEKTTIKMDVDGQIYTANGLKIIENGWHDIYNVKEKEEFLPILSKGDFANIIDKSVSEKKSKAPSRYTDATIIKAMINAGKFTTNPEYAKILKAEGSAGGIGRPSTRAKIIEDLCLPITQKGSNEEKYLVVREKKQFKVTDFGMELANYVDNLSFSNADLTAIWEQKLTDIEEGDMNVEQFIKEQHTYIDELCTELKQLPEQKQSFSYSNHIKGVTCPICGKPMNDGKNYYMCADYKKGCDFIVGKTILSTSISLTELKKLCNGKATKKLKFISAKNQKEFEAKLKYNKETNKVDFNFD